MSEQRKTQIRQVISELLATWHDGTPNTKNHTTDYTHGFAAAVVDRLEQLGLIR